MEGYKSGFYTCVSNIFSTEPPPSAHCFVYIHVCVLVCVHMCLHACSCASIQVQVHVCPCMWAPEDKVSCCSPGESWFFESGSLIDLEPTSGIHCLHLSSSVITNMCHHAWLVLHGFWGVELRTQDLKVKYFTGWVISLALFLILCVNVVKEFDVS